MELSYSQRKALRRISRGQSINKSMLSDLVIKQCYQLELDDLPQPFNELEYYDWVEQARWACSHPTLTPYGKELLDRLDTEPTSV